MNCVCVYHWPLFLINQKAKKSLQFYRNCRCAEPDKCIAIDDEFTELVKVANDSIEKSKNHTSLKDLCKYTVDRTKTLNVFLSVIDYIFS